MGTTPLLDRIKARKPRTEPLPIAERSGPFARRLLAKHLAPKDMTAQLYSNGGRHVSPDENGAA